MDMNKIRENVIHRIECLANAVKMLDTAAEMIDSAAEEVNQGWESQASQFHADKPKGCEALGLLTSRESERITEELQQSVIQFAGLFVRDVIGPELAASDSPVVTLTSNSYMPPIRDYAEVERLWTLDNGDVFETFMETFEQKLNEYNFIVGSPDYDNMLYGIDLNRWTVTNNVDDEDPNGWLNPQSWVRTATAIIN